MSTPLSELLLEVLVLLPFFPSTTTPWLLTIATPFPWLLLVVFCPIVNDDVPDPVNRTFSMWRPSRVLLFAVFWTIDTGPYGLPDRFTLRSSNSTPCMPLLLAVLLVMLSGAVVVPVSLVK